MSTTLIRGGKDAVAVSVDESGIRISLGPDGISASVTLDFGEARLLAETILSDLEALLEVVLEVAHDRGYEIRAGVPDAVWAIVQVGDDDQIEFQKLSRRERDLVVMVNPMLWPLWDRLFVKRWRPNPPPAPKAMPGRMDTGFLRPDRGATVWDGADLLVSYESFEQLVADGWVID